MIEDNTLLVTKSKDDAQALRKAVSSEFREKRPWICVVLEGETFRVTIDGPWGTRLPDEEEGKVKAFAKQFAKTVSDPVSEKN
jgi:hypothetical protein